MKPPKHLKSQEELIMKEVIVDAIAAFAKQHKIGKAKVEEFAGLIIAEVKPKSSYVPKGTPRGRKASDETVALRAKIEKFAKANTGKCFTVKQIADKLHADRLMVNNTINFLMKKEVVVFQRAGTAEKPAGKRGKPETIWKIGQ